MAIKTMYIDHNVIKRYFVLNNYAKIFQSPNDDVDQSLSSEEIHLLMEMTDVWNDANVTCIYDAHFYGKTLPYINGYNIRLTKSKDYDILTISNSYPIDNIHFDVMLIGFNIECVNVSKAFVCINELIVSSFLISKRNDRYPHLALLRNNVVELMVKKGSIRRVEMVSIYGSMINIKKLNTTYAHIDVKINNFGPTVTYHNDCMCYRNSCVTFYDDDHSDVKRTISKTVKITKIHELCKRVVQLLMFNTINKDILIHICTIMYYII